jgi:maltose/moltooligosaccharide transporter
MASDTRGAGVQAGGRPRFGFWAIWNMCFGFLGLQFAFGLQNANVSRIFQTLGADLDDIPALWIAAPFTGLLVQPLIGYWSDRTWGPLGRRRPYFVAGALLTAVALLAMPHSPALWVAAVLLWLLDASINISMEPFRAFVGDQLPPAQRASGYAMQGFFIGVGAVIAGMLPWLLERAGVSNHGMDATGHAIVTDTVRYSFTIGAIVLLLAMGWTVLRTREYPPTELAAHGAAEAQQAPEGSDLAQAATLATPDAPGGAWQSLPWLALGAALLAIVAHYRLDKQLYLVGAGALGWGIAQLAWRSLGAGGMFGEIMHDMHHMPLAMRRLVPVQFFSWVALFAMWIYTTPAVTAVHFHSSDPASDAYNEGATWVGVLFGAYNGFAALAAMAIPAMVRRLGLRASHCLNLVLGAAGFFSVALIRDPQWLLASMVGVGIAWASILSLPYALLADSVPAQKMGLYMGIFNFFIVIPQLLAASVLGFVLKVAFSGQPLMALVIGGASFLVAGLLALRVPQPRAH